MTNAESCKRWREANRYKYSEYVEGLSPARLQVIAERKKVFLKEQRLRRRAIIDQFKVEHGCQNPACLWSGEFMPCDLDFHHIDPHAKHKSIALMHNSSGKKIIEEIGKCTILCAVCHRRATYANLDCSQFKLCEVAVELSAQL